MRRAASHCWAIHSTPRRVGSCTGVAIREPGSPDDLLHQRGLAHLPRAGHDLDEPSRLGQPAGEFGRMRAGRSLAIARDNVPGRSWQIRPITSRGQGASRGRCPTRAYSTCAYFAHVAPGSSASSRNTFALMRSLPEYRVASACGRRLPAPRRAGRGLAVPAHREAAVTALPGHSHRARRRAHQGRSRRRAESTTQHSSSHARAASSTSHSANFLLMTRITESSAARPKCVPEAGGPPSFY